ncbi:hypothetical protein EW146_g8543, partial [Bondarzewia mesenterica]
KLSEVEATVVEKISTGNYSSRKGSDSFWKRHCAAVSLVKLETGVDADASTARKARKPQTCSRCRTVKYSGSAGSAANHKKKHCSDGVRPKDPTDELPDWPQPLGIFTGGSHFHPTAFLLTVREMYERIVIAGDNGKDVTMEDEAFAKLLMRRTVVSPEGTVLFRLYDSLTMSPPDSRARRRARGQEVPARRLPFRLAGLGRGGLRAVLLGAVAAFSRLMTCVQYHGSVSPPPRAARAGNDLAKEKRAKAPAVRTPTLGLALVEPAPWGGIRKRQVTCARATVETVADGRERSTVPVPENPRNGGVARFQSTNTCRLALSKLPHGKLRPATWQVKLDTLMWHPTFSSRAAQHQSLRQSETYSCAPSRRGVLVSADARCIALTSAVLAQPKPNRRNLAFPSTPEDKSTADHGNFEFEFSLIEWENF